MEYLDDTIKCDKIVFDALCKIEPIVDGELFLLKGTTYTYLVDDNEVKSSIEDRISNIKKELISSGALYTNITLDSHEILPNGYSFYTITLK